MEFLQTLVGFLAAGGHLAIIGLLVLIIAALGYDRVRMLTTMTTSQEQLLGSKNSELVAIKEIVERYHTGNLNLVQALNEIKIVLITIQATIRG